MITTDTMLGPYRISAAIGAGGMGVVYKATDTRLGRQVAVKVLSANLTHDEDAARRFAQEARAAGQLNHPNILAIYDIGEEDGRRYIVSELLEGESLRARIRQGAIPPRKAADIAAQIARGLAAAHERGIIHRDLKPENVFITRDGIVKILDFGLVKLMTPRLPGSDEPGEEAATTLRGTPTEPGRILGTIGYMAPEQVRGGSGDHRSDLFAFGAILFEMLTGRAAFRGESAIETLNSILKDEPPEFGDLGVRVPGALERITRHCLEKNPEERFQSARDVAFDLGGMSGLTSQILTGRRFPRFGWRRLVTPILVVALALAAATAAYIAGTRNGRRPPPSFKRLTFRSGTILTARFSPDSQTVFYGVRLSGGMPTVFSARADSPESRDLGFGPSTVLSVSNNGQLAISLRPRFIGYLREAGTLATVSIAGGAPREVLEDVEAADWSPDGRSLAVVRSARGHCNLEYPIGKPIYSTTGYISHPRFSPKGDRIAFVDHPFVNDDRGSVAIMDIDGTDKRTLSAEWQSIQGLTWRADRNEIWFAAERNEPLGRTITAVDMKGRERVAATSAGTLWLHDIAADGRLLVTQQNIRAGISAVTAGSAEQRDLSWLDYSVVRDLAADGTTIAFSESGEAGGPLFGVYLRRLDGSPAVRLGEGTTESLSRDGKWVLSIARNRKPAQIMMLPTGVGQSRPLTNDQIDHRSARWFPDGRRVLFQGNLPKEAPRLWVQEVGGGPARPISPSNVSGGVITSDGRFVLGRGPDRHFYLYPAEGGEPQPVPTLRAGDVPLRFSADGKSLYVGSFGKIPATLTLIDLATGARTIVFQAAPSETAGLVNVGPVLVTPDGKTMVYSYTRILSDLYLLHVR